MSDFDDVHAFHERFDLPRPATIGVPRLMSPDALGFRFKFLCEELDEFRTAHASADLVKTVDGLVDFVYVVYGTALFLGVGRYAFGEYRWPDFAESRSLAAEIGFPIAERPALLAKRKAELFAGRLHAEIAIFAQAHGCGELGVAIAHLWNAAAGAYETAAALGAPWDECWRAVQTANLAKVRAARDGSDSKRGSAFDVVKPAGWVAPEAAIRAALIAAGAEL